MASFYRLIISVFFVSVNLVYSQTNGQLVEGSLDLKIPFTITQYATKHGLPQSQVLDIVERKNGNLIIATANGIVEYNGREFVEFINDKRYKKFICVKLFWDEQSKTLYGQELGGTLHQLYPEVKLINNCVASHVSGNKIYTITRSGVLFVANAGENIFSEFAKTGISNPLSLINYNDELIVSTEQGVYSFSTKLKTIKKLSDKPTYNANINQFTNELYFFSESKVYKLKNGTEELVLEIDRTNYIYDIAFTDTVECYIATSNGLYQIYDGYIDKYTQRSSLPSQFLQSLYYSKNDNCLFVGTGEKGLLKLQFKSCYSFSAKEGFAQNVSLSSIIRTKKGQTLISGYCCDLYKLGSDTVTAYSKVKNNFASLAEVEDTIYAGTWGDGIVLIKDENLVGNIKGLKKLPNDYVHAVFQDSKKNIWVGTSSGISKGKCSIDLKPLLVNEIKGDIVTFHELENGNICVGGSSGAFIINVNSEIEELLNEEDGLTGKEVRSFFEDEEGKLWIGTYGGGIYCYSKNKLTSINKMKNAKLSDDAFCLAYDDLGYFFLTSNHGLWRIKYDDLNDFYYGRKKYLVPFYYGEAEGIYNTEFNGGFQNNYLRTSYNHFYFPTLQGIVIVTPEEPKFRKLQPLINKIIANDTLVLLKNAVLDRATYSLSFHFSAVTFSEKNNLYYQYKLEGDDKSRVDWSPLQKESEVNFRMLPPGKYIFSVRAIDAFNDINPSVAKYTFEIKPYFYETGIFQVVFLFILLAIVYLIARKRALKKRREIEIEQRTGRLVAELELKALQAQMNPHFVFNSLNSIKYFLSTNNVLEANKYIDYFSILIRKFLDYSNNSLISIEEELTIINSYLELEKMRLNKKFNFSIKVADEVKSKKIPTFIIQPFIENAVKHGIAPSDRQCNLILEFKVDKNKVVCIIDDDGIGRKESQKLKLSPKTHKSKGVELVREKISIIEEIYKAHIEVQILDKEKNGIAEGTSVIIEIEDKL